MRYKLEKIKKQVLDSYIMEAINQALIDKIME